jgi:hypothetical protein
MAWEVSGTTWEIRGALAPFGQLEERQCAQDDPNLLIPPLSSLASSFWSFGVTSTLRGGRPVHRVPDKQFYIKMVFTRISGGQEPSPAWTNRVEQPCGDLRQLLFAPIRKS